MNPTPVCILLATLNGSRYVAAQLESIQNQTYKEWILLVSDDGSEDGTWEKINEFAKNDSRIIVLDRSDVSSGGAKQNFERLINEGLQTESDVFFLCDQDDIWEVNKLQSQFSEFPNQGAEQDALLVHSDLSVVDESLEVINRSMASYMALNMQPPEPFNYLLSRNFVTGCASAANRQLLKEALPFPEEAVMHDWWLALVASISGRICYMNQALVKYRQHGSNTIGASGFWQGLNPARNWREGWAEGNEWFLATFSQAEALLARKSHQGSWSSSKLSVLIKYVTLLEGPVRQRISVARELGLRHGSIVVRCIFWLRLLTIRADHPK